MENQLALVVDDSKTARVTLKRMLEKHNLDVDTLESAQQALDYLVDKVPDVIFMDHMMPGMDGFEAVEAIKSNPATATIPIMMYTSKGGDLYVSQARALGAVGILPKQVEPAELFEVLNNLGLAKERRKSRNKKESSFVLMDEAPEVSVEAAGGDIQEIANQAAEFVGDHGNIHGHLGELLENYHHEMLGDIRDLRESIEQLAGSRSARSRYTSGPFTHLVVVLVMLIPLLWLYNMNSDTRAALGAANKQVGLLETAHQQQQIAANAENTASASLRAMLDSQESRASEQSVLLYDSITWAINQSSPYDVREEAYSDRRLAIIQELVSRLSALGFTGIVQLDSHLGEFCLTGNDVDGYILASPDLPVTECAMIGHPLQQLPSLGERQSIAFANFLATSPLLNNGDISIELVPYLYSRPRVNYPPQHSNVSAFEWNRIGAANNRVDVTLLPASE
jgi:CheY-like chemotaxis protein